MKKYNAFVLILAFLFVAFMALSQSYTYPDFLSPYDIAEWTMRGGNIASGSASPSVVASAGALYFDETVATQPALYRSDGATWNLVSAAGEGVSSHSLLTELDFESADHTGFNSAASHTLHLDDYINPHGATMTVEQQLIIGDSTATAVAYIDSPSDGLLRMASFTSLVYETDEPTSLLSSDSVTFWADNASKALMVYDGEEWANITGGTYGEIYVNDGVTAESIPTGASYTILTGFVTDGSYNDCSPTVASDCIVINRPGVYRIGFSVSFTGDTNNVVWRIAAFKNAVEMQSIHIARKVSTATDVGSAAGSGFIGSFAEGDILDLRARHDSGTAAEITPVYMNLNVERIGH